MPATVLLALAACSPGATRPAPPSASPESYDVAGIGNLVADASCTRAEATATAWLTTDDPV